MRRNRDDATQSRTAEILVRRILVTVRTSHRQDSPALSTKMLVLGIVVTIGAGRRSCCHGAKFPKAVARITDDVQQLLAFYDFPAEHWVHLRTTNPIESTFATVRNRSKITKGPGSRAAGIAMAYKLIEAAQSHWRAVNAPQLVALVRAGTTFENGKLVERRDDDTTTKEAA
jgi:hypothetical protein